MSGLEIFQVVNRDRHFYGLADFMYKQTMKHATEEEPMRWDAGAHLTSICEALARRLCLLKRWIGPQINFICLKNVFKC